MTEERGVIFSVEAKMRLVREEALEKGDKTNFSFLVGPEGEAQLLHCFEGDLMLASDYFGPLVRGGPLAAPLPVRIKHIKPHIFKLILRFISLHTISELSTIEDALALTFAADEFLLDDLKPFCQSEIERLVTVETMWQSLNKFNNIPQFMPVCTKLLSSETRMCLAHSTFLEASQESLIFALKLEEMDISSEVELVEACLKLATSLPEESGKELMKAALPHLRLQTLIADDFTPALLKHLTGPEKEYLMVRLAFKNIAVDDQVPANLNPNTCPRTPTRVPKLAPGPHILTVLPYLYPGDDYDKKGVACQSSTLSLYARCDVLLTGIAICAKIKHNDGQEYMQVEVSKGGKLEISQWITASLLVAGTDFKRPALISKGERVEISVKSKKKGVYPLLLESTVTGVTASLKSEAAFSHVNFKNSIDAEFHHQISKCFMIKSVNYEVVKKTPSVFLYMYNILRAIFNQWKNLRDKVIMRLSFGL